MFDTSSSGIVYNRFTNLDSIEDRIIYFLLTPKNKNEEQLKLTHDIWRLLMYNDVNALIDDEEHPLPRYSDVAKLIYNNNEAQDKYRIFRSPRLEDGFTEQCSLIKVYVDSIIPSNHLLSIVNIGIDIISNSKIINVAVPDDEINVVIDEVDGVPVRVQSKSRITVLVHAVLSLLNGADVAGIGRMIFSRQLSIFNQAQYGLWNNRNFEGVKLVIGVNISGVQ